MYTAAKTKKRLWEKYSRDKKRVVLIVSYYFTNDRKKPTHTTV
jgi:hypothetical protein